MDTNRSWFHSYVGLCTEEHAAAGCSRITDGVSVETLPPCGWNEHVHHGDDSEHGGEQRSLSDPVHPSHSSLHGTCPYMDMLTWLEGPSWARMTGSASCHMMETLVTCERPACFTFSPVIESPPRQPQVETADRMLSWSALQDIYLHASCT